MNRIDEVREALKQREPCDDENCPGWDIFECWGSEYYKDGDLVIQRCDICGKGIVTDDDVEILPEAQAALRAARVKRASL